jgi:2-polyprenyl-3-methyl-5-hydroxy-6-metoxy-1,4-benzoquinol methylase
MSVDKRLEGDFYQYMHQLGQVDEAWNKEVLEFYVRHFTKCHYVLDVGCGEGQFIELLSAEGIDAVGIDTDARMVESCRDKGLQVVQADLFDYLPQYREAFDGVFSSNLIEHLSAEDAFRFVELAFKSLSPGGVFLTATPNPASLIVHLHEFWRDATHVRLYTSSLLEFLLSRSGFERVLSGENPKTTWKPPAALDEVPQLLEDLSDRRKTDQRGWIFKSEPSLVNQERDRSCWQRLISNARRQLANFLAETILFEEFAGLHKTLSGIRQEMTTLQHIDRALYHNLNKLLVAPREIYAKGLKPAVQSE